MSTYRQSPRTLRTLLQLALGNVVDKRARAHAAGSIAKFGTEVARSAVTGASIWLKWGLAGLPGHGCPVFDSRAELLRHSANLAPPSGLWLEFGVYRGETTNLLANLTTGRVYGFDSFKGLPSSWSPSLGVGFFDVDGKRPSLSPNVVIVEGWFQDTLPGFVRSIGKDPISLLHVDCDLYQSARVVLLELSKNIGAGTIIVFDEFVGPMVDDECRAFRDFLDSTQHRYSYIGCSLNGSVAIRIVT